MKKPYVVIALMSLILFGIFVPLFAAQAKEAASATAAAGAKSMTLLEMWKVGGWCMWPLGAFSIAMFYFIIRNGLLLRPKNLLRADLKPEIEEMLARRDIQGVREICQNNPCLMTAVLDAGLERVTESDTDVSHISEAIEEAGNEQMVTFMKPINALSIIGGTAPMIGLLGTVSGMIKAFQSISAGGMGKPEVLAGNIGEALITTAAGLIIAIPAMICYFNFKNDFIKHMSIMSRMISHFMNVYRNAR